MKEQYWLIPPEIYNKLNDEFHFDYDPCPCPCPEDYNGLEAEWGQSNWVNPPFTIRDNKTKVGVTAWARKAVEEWRKGKRVVFIGPVRGAWIYPMIEVGAELRSMGRVRYLECKTKEPWPSPILSILAVI